jgi:uncharacterized protein YciI
MNQFIYHLTVIRPEMLTGGPDDTEKQVVTAHFDYLKRATEAGVVILASRTATDDPGTFGIVVFLAPDEDAARAFMAADPAVAGGVMTARLWPFRVALMGERPEVG